MATKLAWSVSLSSQTPFTDAFRPIPNANLFDSEIIHILFLYSFTVVMIVSLYWLLFIGSSHRCRPIELYIEISAPPPECHYMWLSTFEFIVPLCYFLSQNYFVSNKCTNIFILLIPLCTVIMQRPCLSGNLEKHIIVIVIMTVLQA